MIHHFLPRLWLVSICTASAIGPILQAQPTVPQWIWSQPSSGENDVIYLRKIFEGKPGAKTKIAATCDNEMRIFVNGEKVVESRDWQIPQVADITRHLVPGKNLIAIQAKNHHKSTAGFVAKVTIDHGDHKETIVTDSSWKVSSSSGTGWNQSLTFDDSRWKESTTIAAAGTGPWAATIHEKSLDQLLDLTSPEATAISAIQVKEGFKVELLYSVPMAEQGSWVAACFDDQGRMITSDQYGKLYRITLPTLSGKPEETKVEMLPVEIGEAQGLTYAFDALYVITNSETYPRGLYRVTDTDKNDQFDKVEPLRLFTNTGGEHGPHAVFPGPDGKSLYVVVGNQTPITEMSSSRVPLHWGEDNLLEPPLMGRGFMAGVMAPGGWIAKTDPDGKAWELITTGFRNPYDAAFHRDGSLFTFDADMEWDLGVPWYRPTRVCEVISGGDYGWRSLSKKWPVRWEDGLSPVVDIGPGSPTGVTFGYGANFPKKYQDALYVADWSYGKLYAVHLKPDGAGYSADTEEFISASPLPLTDLAVNPKDGAMYFLIGGRRVQSGIYRITAIEGKTDGPAVGKPPLLDLRRQLEAFHGKQDPKAVDFAWRYLDHEDRLIRFAARVAIEHQPVGSWKEKALAEKNPRASINALMALIRSGEKDKSLLAPILASLDRIDLAKLEGMDRVSYLRSYQLAFSRFGEPDEETRIKTAKKLSAHFPTKEPFLDIDLVEILTYLRNVDFLPKAIDLLETAPTQEEQIAYAKSLRLAQTGWTPELRERFLKWVCLRAPLLKGGASFPMFMEDIKKDTVAGLSEGEKVKFKELLETQPDVKSPAFQSAGREFVKNWTVEEIDPLLAAGLEGDRNFDNGRNLFGATACFTCHRFGSEGGAIGPDLTSVAGKYSPRDLLAHILDPNREISDQYGQIEITLIDDRKVYGRIMNLNGDSISLNIDMMNPNAIQNVDRKRIKSMGQSKTSMMPPGLLNTCKDTDILDLLAYLLSKGDKNSPLFK